MGAMYAFLARWDDAGRGRMKMQQSGVTAQRIRDPLQCSTGILMTHVHERTMLRYPYTGRLEVIKWTQATDFRDILTRLETPAVPRFGSSRGRDVTHGGEPQTSRRAVPSQSLVIFLPIRDMALVNK